MSSWRELITEDTTRFIRAQDVLTIYNLVVKQSQFGTGTTLAAHSAVTRLNAIRDEQSQNTLASDPSSSRSSVAPPAPPELNRVDTVIGDVFALLSLFFLTIGKSRETPALYGQIFSMRVSLAAVEYPTFGPDVSANPVTHERDWRIYRTDPTALSREAANLEGDHQA